jgi:hypothetical protein
VTERLTFDRIYPQCVGYTRRFACVLRACMCVECVTLATNVCPTRNALQKQRMCVERVRQDTCPISSVPQGRTHVRTHTQGHELFAIFEDDVWLAPDLVADKEAEEEVGWSEKGFGGGWSGEGEGRGRGGGWGRGMGVTGAEGGLKAERRGSLVAAHRRLVAAVEALPATADVLYLEMCGERCAELRYAQRA